MTNFDPTTNRVPFGLLSQEEQKILKAWPHGWEYWSPIDGWEWKSSSWSYGAAYRGKPAPVVTSVWVNFYHHQLTGGPCKSRQTADATASETRIAVLRIDTCKGVSTVTVEEI